MEPLISIIMPVYNQKKYLKASVDSVIAQTFEQFELILVDDGSTDGSSALCTAAAENDSRIRVIRKRNGGVSSARNAGLCAARGVYIGFVDADDLIEKDYYEKMYHTAKENDCDLVSSSYYKMRDGDLVKNESDHAWFDEVNMKLDREQILSAVLPAMYLGSDCPVWNKLYKREIIVKNRLRFKRYLKIGEDYVFTLEYLFCAQSYYYMTDGGYLYFMREGSAMQRIGRDYAANFVRVYRNKKRLMRKAGSMRETLTVHNRSWMLMIGEDFLIEKRNVPGFKMKLVRLHVHAKMTWPMNHIWHAVRLDKND